jgi:hypothetical protein
MVSQGHDDEVPTLSLFSRVLQSEAWRIQCRLYALAMVDDILRVNYEELTGLLTEALETPPPDDLWGRDDTEWVSGLLDELVRRLVNFLSSAKMRVDQSTTMRNEWYKGTVLEAEWKKEARDRFSGNPVFGFIENLRNFALHYRLPATSTQLTSTVDIAAQTLTRARQFVLSKSELRQWKGWTKGMQYLQATDDDIPIPPLLVTTTNSA